MTISRQIVLILATATWCSGHYVGLLLIGSGLDAALGFELNLQVLCFLYVIRDRVEW